MRDKNLIEIKQYLERIATALEKNSTRSYDHQFQDKVYLWQPEFSESICKVEMNNTTPMDSLFGIDEQKLKLYQNTLQFVNNYPANNVLLWGGRGTGKSSLVKSVADEIQKLQNNNSLVLIEIYREDLSSLYRLLDVIREHKEKKFLIFCDDLSFDAGDERYKSLKSILEGGVEGRPEHVLFYATSNRRHLISREMRENQEKTMIHEGESIEENVSLSDRFGLWIGFHSMDQDTYLVIVENCLKRFGIELNWNWQYDAKKWSRIRGHLSGRTAYQCACDIAGKKLMDKSK